MIAQELALRHPHRVISLLLGCTSYGALFSRWPEMQRGPGVTAVSNDRMSRERAFVPLLYSQSTPLEMIEEDLRVRAQCHWSYRGFLGQLGGILLWHSYRRLPRIQAPTMVVHGDEDRIVPLSNGRRVAKRIPGAQFKVIPRAGHVMTTDQPELCSQIMSEFLELHKDKSASSAASV